MDNELRTASEHGHFTAPSRMGHRREPVEQKPPRHQYVPEYEKPRRTYVGAHRAE
jgi:hypothetical protein